MANGKAPVKVLITGAAGQIAYSLVFMVARGDMLGYDQPVVLHLLDIAPAMEALSGVVMELEDGAFPLLHGIVATDKVKDAFDGVKYALFVGSIPRREGMERKDLLTKNASIFKEQGKALNDFAAKDVKVLVVGNPANTNALIAQHFAPSLPKENFSALTRLDHNRAKAQIAKKLNVGVDSVHNVVIWGNHSSTQYPDVTSGYVVVNGQRVPIKDAINDDTWLQTEFLTTVQQRGTAVIKVRKLSSAASAATAIVNHMHDWIFGLPEGQVVSMAVSSDGSYHVPEGLIFSYPVTLSGGKYKILQGVKLSEFSTKKLEETRKELEEEKKQAMEFLN